MHVRISTRKRGGKVYRYVQIVQSYRRPDGMPAHRVLASLGDLSELETQNLRNAIAASREGRLVLLPSEAARQLPPRKVRRNLAWLDVAVVHHILGEWELRELIDRLAPIGEGLVSAGTVVEALVAQRCVAPASKLAATRWYRRTALPELQGVAPGRFNNTRIHRALEVLDDIESGLQRQLAKRIEARSGAFASLFLDCTDTWFVGRGPELAERAETKEGLYRRKVGIVLLCDQRGNPLRWATLPGDHREVNTMTGMVDEVSGLDWAQGVPLVVDRAMGRGVTVEGLLGRDVRFVTAVPRNEIASYSPRIPLGAFDRVARERADDDAPSMLAALCERASELGLEAVSPKRWLLDLGVFAKGDDDGGMPRCSRAVAALRLARRLRVERDSGDPVSVLAQRYDVRKRSLRRWLELLDLAEELQRRILAGEGDRIPLSTLQRVAKMRKEEQPSAFDSARQEAGDGPPLVPNRELASFAAASPSRLRGVVVFNPERFLEQRKVAEITHRKLETLVADINRRLRSPNSRRDAESVLGEIGAELRRRHLVKLYRPTVDELVVEGRQALRLRLERDDGEWERKHRTDGLNLVVAHPSIHETTAGLAKLYFAKDKVEKDFQDIKSVIGIRPVNHRTDPKVRAHVTLCMLALLAERSLEQRLVEAGLPMTAAAALSTLQSGHLNLYAAEEPLYSATEPEPDQASILAALGMERLTDDEELAEILIPR